MTKVCYIYLVGELDPSVFIIITLTLLGLLVVISAVGSVFLVIAFNKLNKMLQSELQPISKRVNDLVDKIDTEVQAVHQTEVVIKVSNLMTEGEQLLHEARASMAKIDTLSEDLELLAGNANAIVSSFEQKEIVARLAGILDDSHRIAVQVEKSLQKVNTWTDTTDRAMINIEDRIVTANKRLSDFNSLIDGVKAGLGAGVDALLHNSKVDRNKKLNQENNNEQKRR